MMPRPRHAASKDSVMQDHAPDLLQALRALLPSFIGVILGMFVRWSRDARTGKVKSLRRVILLDVPTVGALSIIAGMVSQRLDADPITASSIGVAFGVAGLEVVNSFVAARLRGLIDLQQAPSQQDRG